MPPKPFKPPRPSTTAASKSAAGKSTSTPTTSASRNSTNSKVTKSKPKPRNSSGTAGSAKRANALPSLSPDSSQASGSASSPEPSVNRARPAPQREEPQATIPPKLLGRLLHEFFKHDNTRINQDAGVAIGRYMETFVREALARAAFAKEGEDGERDGSEFLEVEDLEKLAPQLLLDF
ncbi:CENP-S associating centromere protein X-domain-containing protein [Xylogone sp. PMI_703]|nr:CENP-S associating centromere protein X-domain-containing protein [Xylogone sp. PMI_703]